MAPSNACEQFEIELEMRLHGALPAGRAGALEGHLATCAACLTYEVRARSADDALRAGPSSSGTVDWTAMRRRVVSWRYAGLVGAILYSGAVLWLTATWWLERLGRSSSAIPSVSNLPLDVLVAAALGAFLVRGAWARMKDARETSSPEYLNHLHHEDLVNRIASARRGTWLWLPFFACLLLARRPRVSAAALAVDALMIALVLWERFVTLPRLEREEQDLPFFDDFPHIS